MQTLAPQAAERRRGAGEAFFGAEAERIARLCHRMAERFARGGRLVAFGEGPVARSDARHVAVEFVHPVIVGKRALPALALTAEGGPVGEQLRLLAEPDDIVLAFGAHADTLAALRTARERRCLTVATGLSGAEWELVPARTSGELDDAAGELIAQELVETLYHVLWELVHVFFEHRGLLEGRSERIAHDAGASSFLYPFLAEQEDDLESVVADVRASVLEKASEAAQLRTQTLGDGERTLREAARALRARLDAGGRVLALGNGGSATDAMDAVADLRFPPGGWRSRGAIDLTEDPGILTAIANDVGEEAVFSRQVIAHGRPADALLAFSTSGGSRNVLAALAEARRRGLATLAFVGYDGGRIAAEGLADHVIVTRSEHIPRIQEAQASAWHVLRELVETGGD
ncbi:MAG TPA: SIS domain-containing protein [Solirubrobacteraceae bacterium]|jgi:D-sedoheptulose 7-phosphate isomerase|nr:SIS domain-containing protein [Solirubrobacteraceae bacterium]